MSNYRKTMGQAIEEMYPINEDNMDLMRKAAGGAMQKIKMKDGKLQMDSFTASAIMKVYDKVNPANQKKMATMINKGTKDGMMKLQDFAMKQVKSENDPEIEEEVDLDEGKMKDLLIKAQELMGPSKNRKEGIQMVAKGLKVSEKEATKLVDEVIKMKMNEEVDLDEVDRSTYDDRIKKFTGMLKDAEKEKPLDKKWISMLKDRIKSTNADQRRLLGMSEEVDLDEGKLGDQWQKGAKSVKSGSFELVRGKSGVHDIMKSGKKIGTFSYDDEGDNFVANMKGERGQLVGNDIDTLISNFKEEVDLDEGKMSQLHQYIKDKKSAEEIAKLMKVDVKTIKTLMSSNNPEDVEESAASDARRAMSKDKDFSRKDSADDDTDASADDVKGASKNIMMQMRKAQSLNGRFAVEFGDGKKVKIPAKMAIAVQQKYNAQKRPAEKEKFQAKIGKSYKDMLSALKEELQPQKESILERMNRKIKENKDG